MLKTAPDFAAFDRIMGRLGRLSPSQPITLVCQGCGAAVPAERMRYAPSPYLLATGENAHPFYQCDRCYRASAQALRDLKRGQKEAP